MGVTQNQLDGDRLFAEANAWFHRLRASSGAAGDADRAAFARWQGQSPAHEAAWDDLQALLAAVQEPARQVRDALEVERKTAAERSRPPARVFARPARVNWGGWMPQSAAAMLAVVVIGAGILRGPAYLDRLRADDWTDIGGHRSITLADGSLVELNTDTALSIDFSDIERRITLLRGEAWFEVKHDATRPFTVAAGGGETRDIGTRFSVALQNGTATVAVAEGLVEVRSGPPADAVTRLGMGQEVAYGADGLTATHAIDPEQAFAWRQGQIAFRQQPLSEVVAELNRYRTGRIVILDEAVGARIVSGTIELAEADAMLDALQKTLGIKAVSVTPYLTLLYGGAAPTATAQPAAN